MFARDVVVSIRWLLRRCKQPVELDDCSPRKRSCRERPAFAAAPLRVSEPWLSSLATGAADQIFSSRQLDAAAWRIATRMVRLQSRRNKLSAKSGFYALVDALACW